MNNSKASLNASARIIPPDSLLKFGYSPNGGIEFDSGSALLNFSYNGTPKASIGSFGLSVLDGQGLIVGGTSQITAAGVTSTLQMLGTGSFDSRAIIGRFDNSIGHAGLIGLKSRAAIGGSAIVQDDDGVFFIQGAVDDGSDYASRVGRIAFEVDGAPGVNDTPGRIILSTTAPGASTETERIRVDSTGGVFIGDIANANMTVGLTMNQGANDNQILAFKSSDVATGLSSLPSTNAEADDFASFAKRSATAGGLRVEAYGENSNDIALEFNAYGITANTAKNINGWGGINFFLKPHDGANGAANMNADGNVFSVRAQVGGNSRTMFMVDEDGDLFADSGTTTTAVTVFDEEDDISLVRAFDIARSENGTKGIIVDEWDQYATRYESDLVCHGILGDTLANGGLVNVTRLQQLHNGAIWQLNTKHMSLVERVDSLAIELEDATKHLAALTA
ncbi:hypothetical protein JYU04_01285 [Dehalococcoides mccartyi]|nr:hypothetical protein [Dehalococcoides mccartyi]